MHVAGAPRSHLCSFWRDVIGFSALSESLTSDSKPSIFCFCCCCCCWGDCYLLSIKFPVGLQQPRECWFVAAGETVVEVDEAVVGLDVTVQREFEVATKKEKEEEEGMCKLSCWCTRVRLQLNWFGTNLSTYYTRYKLDRWRKEINSNVKNK